VLRNKSPDRRLRNWLRGSATTFAEQFFIIKAQCVLVNETLRLMCGY